MPIIPKFTIDQNDEYILIHIKVPYIKVSAAELITDEREFTFYCKPYLLKLSFPYPLEGEDERCKATYDCNDDNGTLCAYLPKRNHGQVFPDLDLTSKFLQQRLANDKADLAASLPPRIEVLSSTENDGNDENDEPEIEFETLLTPYQTLLSKSTYGFNVQYSNIFTNLREELLDVLEISDPEGTSSSARRKLRIFSENAKFDHERYLGDVECAESDPVYIEAMKYEPFWILQWNTWKGASSTSSKKKPSQEAVPVLESLSPAPGAALMAVEFLVDASSEIDDSKTQTSSIENGSTSAPNASILGIPTIDSKDTAFISCGGFSESEREILSNSLPSKEYLIPARSERERVLLLGLIDILFAFAYEFRLALGELNSESIISITRLSAQFSWLDSFNLPEDCINTVMRYCLRRSLIVPYLRSYKFCRKIWTDVAKILVLGKRCMLKCLLQIRSLFEHTDTHYLLNKIFVDDYCVWLQGVDSGVIQDFAREFNNAKTYLERGTPVESSNKSSQETSVNCSSCKSSELLETRTDSRSSGLKLFGKAAAGLNLEELEAWATAAMNEHDEVGSDEDEEDCSSESDSSSSSSDSDDESACNDVDAVTGIPRHLLVCPIFAEYGIVDCNETANIGTAEELPGHVVKAVQELSVK